MTTSSSPWLIGNFGDCNLVLDRAIVTLSVTLSGDHTPTTVGTSFLDNASGRARTGYHGGANLHRGGMLSGQRIVVDVGQLALVVVVIVVGHLLSTIDFPAERKKKLWIQGTHKSKSNSRLVKGSQLLFVRECSTVYTMNKPSKDKFVL